VVVKRDVMERKNLSDRVINQRRILLNERVPGDFIAAEAAGKEAFLFLCHATC
jgi:hypothetical protein